jgi:hypothetical protein
MSPETAVARLAEIIAARNEFTEDDVYTAMAAAGIPDANADRAYKFTQTAWARGFLTGLGIRFSNDYLCFNGAGEVIESGELPDQPYFAAAAQILPRYAKTPGFQRLALMSAEVNAVNDLLNAGSKPEDVVMSPAAFFMEAPTPTGMTRAQQLLSVRASGGRRTVADQPGAASVKKPWWKFW